MMISHRIIVPIKIRSYYHLIVSLMEIEKRCYDDTPGCRPPISQSEIPVPESVPLYRGNRKVGQIRIDFLYDTTPGLNAYQGIRLSVRGGKLVAYKCVSPKVLRQRGVILKYGDLRDPDARVELYPYLKGDQ